MTNNPTHLTEHTHPIEIPVKIYHLISNFVSGVLELLPTRAMAKVCTLTKQYIVKTVKNSSIESNKINLDNVNDNCSKITMKAINQQVN